MLLPQRLVAAALLLACVAGTQASGGYVTFGGKFGYPGERIVNLQEMVPQSAYLHYHDAYWQIPANPVGTVYISHGCAHAASNYWPKSADCPECEGLPEELSHVWQALKKGYAVLAVSSLDRATGCWSWGADDQDVAAIINEFLADNGLDSLPLYGFGISSGSTFLLKLPHYVQFSGLVSDALGVVPEGWGPDKVSGGYPPTIFCSMERDTKMIAKIATDVTLLQSIGRPVDRIKVYTRQTYPSYFSARSPYISSVLSTKIFAGLQHINMTNSSGWVVQDPRYTKQPWASQLAELVPELNNLDSTITSNAGQVWELMNVAYAEHEIISDYVTAALMWFESGLTADLTSLVQQWTYGLPTAAELAGIEALANAKKASRSNLEDSGVPPPDVASVSTSPQQVADGSSASPQQVAAGSSASPSQQQQPATTMATTTASGGAQSHLGAILGGAIGGACVVFLVAALALTVLHRRRSSVAPAGMSAPMVHPAEAAKLALGAPGNASIIPGVKERFELTEVVEQTGSPYSARRRVRTPFHPQAQE